MTKINYTVINNESQKELKIASARAGCDSRTCFWSDIFALVSNKDSNRLMSINGETTNNEDDEFAEYADDPELYAMMKAEKELTKKAEAEKLAKVLI
jgi:hypothetical protein